eukprot:360488-Chlamydomonas_euryale.AAC.11
MSTKTCLWHPHRTALGPALLIWLAIYVLSRSLPHDLPAMMRLHLGDGRNVCRHHQDACCMFVPLQQLRNMHACVPGDTGVSCLSCCFLCPASLTLCISSFTSGGHLVHVLLSRAEKPSKLQHTGDAPATTRCSQHCT